VDVLLGQMLRRGRPHSSMLKASILLCDLVDFALRLLRRLIGIRELPMTSPGYKTIFTCNQRYSKMLESSR
jgi:hypothetical protein